MRSPELPAAAARWRLSREVLRPRERQRDRELHRDRGFQRDRELLYLLRPESTVENAVPAESSAPQETAPAGAEVVVGTAPGGEQN